MASDKPAVYLKNQGKSKVTTDELGNKTRENWDGSQDVKIMAPKFTLASKVQEERRQEAADRKNWRRRYF